MGGTQVGQRSVPRRLLLTVLLPVALSGTAACTSGTASGRVPGRTASTAPVGSSAPVPGAIPSLPSTPPATAAELARLMQRGFAATESARITFSTALSGNSLAGSGRLQLAQGGVTGLDVRATVSEVGPVHYLLVDSVSYAALPSPTKPGKPYVVLGGGPGGEALDRAAIGLQATKLLAAPSTYRTLVSATDTLTFVGREKIGESPALHYRGPVTVANIPTNDQVRIALSILSVTSVHLDLWVDGLGRPLKASAPASGRSSDVIFTDINQPVHIAKPPASQVDG